MSERDGETAWYIATVWIDDEAADRIGARPLAHDRLVLRSQAISPEDYRVRVRKQFGAALTVTFGPIGLSTRQG